MKAGVLKFMMIASFVIIINPSVTRAQGPQGKSFGFGIVLGTLDGASVKVWAASDQAFVADFGGSWFGPLRLQGDYLWHFDAFHSSIVKMYAGPGVGIAFGNEDHPFFHEEDQTGSVGVGVRVMFGVNVIPRRTPLEIFAEVGPMIGFVPDVGVGIDGGVGIRFYPYRIRAQSLSRRESGAQALARAARAYTSQPMPSRFVKSSFFVTSAMAASITAASAAARAK